jgi:hypothetical protein
VAKRKSARKTDNCERQASRISGLLKARKQRESTHSDCRKCPLPVRIRRDDASHEDGSNGAARTADGDEHPAVDDRDQEGEDHVDEEAGDGRRQKSNGRHDGRSFLILLEVERRVILVDAEADLVSVLSMTKKFCEYSTNEEGLEADPAEEDDSEVGADSTSRPDIQRHLSKRKRGMSAPDGSWKGFWSDTHERSQGEVTQLDEEVFPKEEGENEDEAEDKGSDYICKTERPRRQRERTTAIEMDA